MIVRVKCPTCRGRGWVFDEDRPCWGCKGNKHVDTHPAKIAKNRNMLSVLTVLRWADEPMTANQIAYAVGVERPRSGNHGTGNVARQMADAVRVTPAITALRLRGLIHMTSRPDGRSGTADFITSEGIKVLDIIERSNPTMESSAATLEEKVAAVRKATGYVDEEEAALELDGITYGDRIRALEDDEDEGVYRGDEGFAIISRVGAAEYGNERAALFILIDQQSSPVEVQPDNVEQI